MAFDTACIRAEMLRVIAESLDLRVENDVFELMVPDVEYRVRDIVQVFFLKKIIVCVGGTKQFLDLFFKLLLFQVLVFLLTNSACLCCWYSWLWLCGCGWQEAVKFMRHSRRDLLTVDDINSALRIRNAEVSKI
jgi:hypothetical protein